MDFRCISRPRKLLNLDGLVKSQNFNLASFRRRPESSVFNMFWMPDQVRHDESGTFYETINLEKEKSIGGGT